MKPRHTPAGRYPLGATVLTPTGRRAVVIGYTDEGRVDLKYIDGGPNTQGRNMVRLWPELVRVVQ